MRLTDWLRRTRATPVPLISEGMAKYQDQISRLLSMMSRKAGEVVREYLSHCLHLVWDLPGDWRLFEQFLEVSMSHVDHPMNRTPFYPVERVYAAAHEVLSGAAAYCVRVDFESGALPLSWQLTMDGPLYPWLIKHGYGHTFSEYTVDDNPYPLTTLAGLLLLPGSFLARLPAENQARFNAAMEGGKRTLLPLVEAVHDWKLRVNAPPADVFIGETHSHFAYPESLRIAAHDVRPAQIADHLQVEPHTVEFIPDTAARPLTLECLSLPNARLAWACLDLYQRAPRGDRPLWLLPRPPLFSGMIRQKE